MKLTWFGHSGFRIDTGRAAIIIDPFMTGNAVFKGRADDAARGATHVILTHGHDDHVGDTVDICRNNDATLIAVWELANHLKEKGVEKIDPTNTGGSIYTEDFDAGGVYLGNPCGLVIRCKKEKHTVYHMGDTAIFGDMALINKLHRPNIGIVPVGDRFTMNPETAAYACRTFFKFKTIIPCHYATFPGYLLPDPSRFVKAMGPLKKSVRKLDFGQSVEL
jgi:L-ascorbate metabolism protein UlaG (beta-lactamase superfamily)